MHGHRLVAVTAVPLDHGGHGDEITQRDTHTQQRAGELTRIVVDLRSQWEGTWLAVQMIWPMTLAVLFAVAQPC